MRAYGIVSKLVCSACLAALALPASAIIGGTTPGGDELKQRGLVIVDGACSGVMISEDWVLTAGHCVPRARPDPHTVVRPAWDLAVERASDAIYQFGNFDARFTDANRIDTGAEFALIHLAQPMPGIAAGYRLQLYQGSLASLRGITVAKFGQGYTHYAEQNPATGGASNVGGAGVYHAFDLQVASTTNYGFNYGPTNRGQIIMPGDSGGPGFIFVQGMPLLVGITSLGGLECFDSSGATVAAQEQRCKQTQYRQSWGEDIGVPVFKAAMEAVLKTTWHPTATSESIWVRRPEIALTKWPLTDLNQIGWAQAARASAQLCYNRGFVGGHFAGHQNVATGEYQLQCSGRGADWRDVTTGQIAATGWGFTDVNAVSWARANRAAERLCASYGDGYTGGHFNGQTRGGNYGLFCYRTGAQWFDATDAQIAATGWPVNTANLDAVPWAQAARAAVGFCTARGFSGGFMNGHHVPGKSGIVCQR